MFGPFSTYHLDNKKAYTSSPADFYYGTPNPPVFEANNKTATVQIQTML